MRPETSWSTERIKERVWQPRRLWGLKKKIQRLMYAMLIIWSSVFALQGCDNGKIKGISWNALPEIDKDSLVREGEKRGFPREITQEFTSTQDISPSDGGNNSKDVIIQVKMIRDKDQIVKARIAWDKDELSIENASLPIFDSYDIEGHNMVREVWDRMMWILPDDIEPDGTVTRNGEKMTVEQRIANNNNLIDFIYARVWTVLEAQKEKIVAKYKREVWTRCWPNANVKIVFEPIKNSAGEEAERGIEKIWSAPAEVKVPQ